MKAFILGLFMWLGLITPPTSLVIDGYDPGGDVSTYLTWLDRISKTGVNVILDGACISACTFVTAMFASERVCVTPRASLGVHQAAIDGKADNDVTTLLETTFYPPWLQTWISNYEKTHGKLTLEVVYIRYDELSKHYRTCTKEEAPIAAERPNPT